MRAGPLSNDEVISLLNSSFVPVYTANTDYHGPGGAPPEERAAHQRIFLESIAKKLGTGDVHVYILDPDGHAIDGLDIGSAMDTAKLLACLRRTVGRLGTSAGKPVVAPRPQSAPPSHPPDTLVLHLTSRGFHHGSWREFPAENWILLPPAEWQRLLPEDPAEGKEWILDLEAARKVLIHFYPQCEETKDETHGRFLEDSLQGTVLSRAGGRARARIEGRLKLKHINYNRKEDPEPVEAEVLGILEWTPGGKGPPGLRLVTLKASRGQEGFGVAVRSLDSSG
jgi:hypothetical protein